MCCCTRIWSNYTFSTSAQKFWFYWEKQWVKAKTWAFRSQWSVWKVVGRPRLGAACTRVSFVLFNGNVDGEGFDDNINVNAHNFPPSYWSDFVMVILVPKAWSYLHQTCFSSSARTLWWWWWWWYCCLLVIVICEELKYHPYSMTPLWWYWWWYSGYFFLLLREPFKIYCPLRGGARVPP